NGDVVLVGSVSGDVNFGGGNLPSPNPATQDAFVARFDAAGGHLSSQRLGDGPADQRASAVAVGADDNAVITGALRGSLNCKAGMKITSMGGADILLTKIGTNNKILWCKAFGDAMDQEGTAVAAASGGDSIVAGWFTGTINLGGMNLTAGAGQTDLFVARFDTSGVHVWSRSFGSTGYAKPKGIAVDPVSGDILIAGYFKGQLTFTGQPPLMTTNNDESAFL